jgi:uncharacterized membrane protein
VERQPPSGPSAFERFEDYPLTRVEYITVMVHFYRAEVSRSTQWRQRLDATTNWAVLTTAGMLSFTFGSSESSPILLLLTNLIVLAYLAIEARRFRYFAVYRARVRMIEENFLIPIVTRTLESPMSKWREMLAGDLDKPKYKTTFHQAFGFRLRRNYVFIFLMILGGWLVKLMIHPTPAGSWREVWSRVSIGHVSGWVVLTLGALFYAGLAAAWWFGRTVGGGEPEDEIAGLESNLEAWRL